MAPTGAARVLVIEDDAGIRQMIGLALTAAGHEVQLVDGRHPISADDTDVVVLDVWLGDRTAWDVLEADPRLAVLPLIITTATAGAGSSPDRLPTGAIILRKPFDLDQLEGAIGRAVRERRASRPDSS